MAENSFFWTTEDITPLGHQVAEYTQAHLSTALEIISACGGEHNGVAPKWPDGLFSASITALDNVQVGAGAAVVDGKAYKNDSALNVSIDAAVGAGNTRIDRIVLRADWSAFKVTIHKIVGTDATTPTAPPLVQTPGTTYDVPLYQVLVDTDGAQSLTTEVDWATISTDDTTLETDPDTGEIRVVDGGISNAEIRNAVGTSVIGRSANSSGDVADIQATANDRLLGRVSGALSFVQLTLGMIPSALITEAKLAAAVVAQLVTNGDSHDHDGGDGAQIPTGGLADLAVTTAKLALQAVDTAQVADEAINSAKAGSTILRLLERQGSDASDWSSPANTIVSNDYTVGITKAFMGAWQETGSAAQGLFTITFPAAYTNKPLVLAITGSDHYLHVRAINVTTTTFQIRWKAIDSASVTDPIFFWLSVGSG